MSGHVFVIRGDLTRLACDAVVLGDTKAGTALALTRSIADKHQGFADDLHLLPITEGTDLTAAARLLEIFLDRVAWRAAREHDLSAEYLLDDNYDSGLNAPDRALASALTTMLTTLPAERAAARDGDVSSRPCRASGTEVTVRADGGADTVRQHGLLAQRSQTRPSPSRSRYQSYSGSTSRR